tara:strand:- start:217 stop:945 length:729 start_codon:yes stop_codon:yes gene_type:complete
MSDNILKVFVGTDGGVQIPAEKALAHSFRKFTSCGVQIEWMDESRGNPFWKDWNKKTWYTPFTCYRWAAPEFCNFEGRSMYMDVDQIILKDPAELLSLEFEPNKAWMSPGNRRGDVIIFDNKKFKEDWWPKINEIKANKKGVGWFLDKLGDTWQKLPERWCCNDGGYVGPTQVNKMPTEPYIEGETCLLHFTEMSWQPWRPYPKRYKYENHRHSRAEAIWWKTYAEALEWESMEREKNVNSI